MFFILNNQSREQRQQDNASSSTNIYRKSRKMKANRNNNNKAHANQYNQPFTQIKNIFNDMFQNFKQHNSYPNRENQNCPVGQYQSFNGSFWIPKCADCNLRGRYVSPNGLACLCDIQKGFISLPNQYNMNAQCNCNSMSFMFLNRCFSKQKVGIGILLLIVALLYTSRVFNTYYKQIQKSIKKQRKNHNKITQLRLQYSSSQNILNQYITNVISLIYANVNLKFVLSLMLQATLSFFIIKYLRYCYQITLFACWLSLKLKSKSPIVKQIINTDKDDLNNSMSIAQIIRQAQNHVKQSQKQPIFNITFKNLIYQQFLSYFQQHGSQLTKYCVAIMLKQLNSSNSDSILQLFMDIQKNQIMCFCNKDSREINQNVLSPWIQEVITSFKTFNLYSDYIHYDKLVNIDMNILKIVEQYNITGPSYRYDQRVALFLMNGTHYAKITNQLPSFQFIGSKNIDHGIKNYLIINSMITDKVINYNVISDIQSYQQILDNQQQNSQNAQQIQITAFICHPNNEDCTITFPVQKICYFNLHRYGNFNLFYPEQLIKLSLTRCHCPDLSLCIQLTDLTLTQVISIQQSYFKNLQCIQNIYLEYCQFDNDNVVFNLQYLCNCQCLKRLYIIQCTLGQIQTIDFQLPQLEVLVIDSSILEYVVIVPKQAKLQSIEIIHLTNVYSNQSNIELIIENQEEILQKMPKLYFITVKNQDKYASVIQQLQQ